MKLSDMAMIAQTLERNIEKCNEMNAELKGYHVIGWAKEHSIYQHIITQCNQLRVTTRQALNMLEEEMRDAKRKARSKNPKPK